MKKWFKIGLAALLLAIAVGGWFAYNLYLLVMGSEPLTGRHEAEPAPMKERPPLTKGLADWPNWRGAGFNGKSTATGIKTDWSNGLKLLWRADYLCQGEKSAAWSAPAVLGNRLVIPGRDNDNDTVFCMESSTGELIWKAAYEAKSESSHGSGPRATPFIDGEMVYTFGRGGDLVCWWLEDGKMAWRKNVRDLGGKAPQWGYSGSPLVFEDKVFVQGGGQALVVAFDKKSGALQWKSLSGEAGYSTIIPMTIADEPALLVYHGTGLSCMEPGSRELWTIPWPTSYFVNATTPLIAGDTIFHSSAYGMGCQAVKAGKDSGTVLWKNKAIQAQHTDPILVDGYIYGYSGDSSNNRGRFKCVELATGKEMWSTQEIGQGTATFTDGHLICLDLKGNLFLVKPDPKQFRKVTEFKTAIEDVKNLSWTVPVVANGKLYLRYLQHLYCYRFDE